MENRKSYLTNKAFKSFLLASLLTVAATQVGTTIDGIMLSYLIGDYAISSVAVCRPVLQVVFALCMLLGSGSSMLTGVAIGNRNRSEANRTFTAVVATAVAAGAVALVVSRLFLGNIIGFLCPDEGLRVASTDYLEVALGGAVFYLLSSIMEMFVAVDGNPRHVTLAVLVCTASNLVFDYVFISILALGMTGAAWASILSNATAVVVLLPHFFKSGNLHLEFSHCMTMLPRCLSVGLPFGLGSMLTAAQMWGNNRIVMAYIGQDGILALSVYVYMLVLSIIVLSGTLKAFQPVTSILKGAGDNQGVKIVIRKAYRIMGISLLVFVLPMVLCPRQVAAVFGVTAPTVVEITSKALMAASANIAMLCLVYMFIPIYQLYGHKGMATFISVSQSLAPTLGLWLLAEVSPDLMWWGFALGQAATAAAIVAYAARKRRHNKNLTPILLVPRDEMADGFETSIPPTIDAMGRMLAETDAFLKSHIGNASLVLHIEVSSEELLKNVITHGYVKQGKRRYIDYRMSILPDSVCVVISDDARPFNPIDNNCKAGLGLLLLRGLCKEIRYDYLFRQNVTTIVFPLSPGNMKSDTAAECE